ncbi:MAG: arylamine N-acetyltransferase [Pseudomonadales bacterium]|nr:arylamine N-acetyltransferase [Pseudomonadales bacterium]
MELAAMTEAYLQDLGMTTDTLDMAFLQSLQSRHIAKHSFNNLAVLTGQEMSLELPELFRKIVQKKRGGYCFEHNKLVFNVLQQLGFDVRLLLARVVYNREIDSPRTHRITLLRFKGLEYIVDAGFGHDGARMPVQLSETSQDHGDNSYRIIKKDEQTYHYQILKDGEFFTLYTFDKNSYTDADCTLGHFYSHRHPDAVFVNNLVVCRKEGNDIRSLRNHQFYHIQQGGTEITRIIDVQQLYLLLTQTFELDIELAVAEFLFSNFISPRLEN